MVRYKRFLLANLYHNPMPAQIPYANSIPIT